MKGNSVNIPVLRPKRKEKVRKAIRKVSKAHSSRLREYMKLRAEFLKAHRYCQHWLAEHDFSESEVLDGRVWWGHAPRMYDFVPLSQDIHHKKGRGKYLLDQSTWMAVSREGHLAIHRNVKDSYSKGYLLPRS